MFRRLRRRFDEKTRRHGISYPWWVGVFSKLLQVVLAIVAVSQRGGPTEPSWAWLGVLLVITPHLVQAAIRPWIPWFLTATCIIAGAAIIMSVPTDVQVDLAPAILAVVAAEVTATDGIGRGVVTMVVAIVVAFVLDVDQTQPTAGEIVIGAMVGAMLWWQSRALLAERAARLREHESAALAERQRIAREIHDLVAHSMSVTLLQVSGARRALLDADIDEASAALRDAEAVGRTAMEDIRRTVGLLADGPSPSHALPDASDVPDLVDSIVGAGLAVDLEVTGDLSAVPRNEGLNLYRIVQEALTNVVKHSGQTRAAVRLAVDECGSRLVVSNPLGSGASSSDGLGHGVAGMHERAAQMNATISAGPRGRAWVVELDVARDGASRTSWVHRMTCPVQKALR